MTQANNGRRNGLHVVPNGQQQRNGTHAAPSGPPIPADMQAEEATLGAILTNPQGFIQVAGWLQAEHFYMERHAIIYRAIQACYSRNTPPDAITVSSELQAQAAGDGSRLDQIGGTSELWRLMQSTPSAVYVEYYADQVVNAARFRQLIQVGGEIAALGYTWGDQTADQALAQAEQRLLQIGRAGVTQEFIPLSQVIDEYYAEINLAGDRSEGTGIPSDYTDLDALLGGFQRSDLLILAARPSTGKTALALNFAYNTARAGKRVGFFSLEMSRGQLLHRLAAMESGIDSQKLRQVNLLTDDEAGQLMETMGDLTELPLYIQDMSNLSISEARAQARRAHLENSFDLIITDYLQLHTAEKQRKNDNRVQEVGQIVRELKAIARELHVPVIALSQLSRAVEGRANHVPMLSDLRESGDIEQAADVVLFLHRPEMYDRQDRPNEADVIIAKHRNGPLGMASLQFDSAIQRFRTLSRYTAIG